MVVKPTNDPRISFVVLINFSKPKTQFIAFIKKLDVFKKLPPKIFHIDDLLIF